VDVRRGCHRSACGDDGFELELWGSAPPQSGVSVALPGVASVAGDERVAAGALPAEGGAHRCTRDLPRGVSRPTRVGGISAAPFGGAPGRWRYPVVQPHWVGPLRDPAHGVRAALGPELGADGGEAGTGVTDGFISGDA